MPDSLVVPDPGTADLENRRSDYLAWLVNRAQPQPVDETADFLASQGAQPASPTGDETADMLAAQGATEPRGGAVKRGLGHALLGVLRTFSYGAGQAGLRYAGLPTDDERAMNAVKMAQANAQTRDLNAQAAVNEQAVKPRLLIDPETNGPMMNPDGSLRVGTLEEQKLHDDRFKLTGGMIRVPEAFATSHGFPEFGGHLMPRTVFTEMLR